LKDQKLRKKLIEVSLPLEVINRESAREKSIRHGHPSTLHLYWARRPLATARAILFSQLVDDPSSHPEKYPTEELLTNERRRLHGILERLVDWDNLNDTQLFEDARAEILASNGGVFPVVLDPFAGGGSIPLEAQRLGLESHASDLNPVAVLLNKSLIEFPPLFAGNTPIFPGAAVGRTSWVKAEGLAEDIRQYGRLLQESAFEKIGKNYPRVHAADGSQLTVIAWIWARTVISPNPANPIEVPLVRSWWLSKRKSAGAYIVPRVENGIVRYTVVRGNDGPAGEDDGTIGRRGGYAVGDRAPISLDYVRSEGKSGRIGKHLMAVVADGPRGRIYISADDFQAAAAKVERPKDVPSGDIPKNPRDFKTPNYGLTKWSDLFSDRQLLALTTLSDEVSTVRSRVESDALAAGLDLGLPLELGGRGAKAYADAVATYLGLAVSRTSDRCSSVCSWDSSRDSMRNVFTRQAIPMVWDYAESNPFSDSSGNYLGQVAWIAKAIKNLPAQAAGFVDQSDASTRDYSGFVISTDPPYYDNIGYADLSDYFYVWLRRSLGEILPTTLNTMFTPKLDELVADPYRHGGKELAENFFVDGFNSVFSRIRQQSDASFPITVYYAYKQQDKDDSGTSSTGWHTLLNGLIASGWEITATWPVRSELSNRMMGHGANALASSIVLACRPRSDVAEASTRRAFLTALKSELPNALRELIQGAIAPVDLAQAAIGPGIAVFSRYSRVREADGSDMSVREALLLINGTLDEVLNEQESDFDPETRFAVKWYKQFGWTEGPSGIADQLARSSDTSISALERGGFFQAKAGKAKLLSPSLLRGDWDPETDENLSVWECAVRLAGIMSTDGAEAVAKLLPGVENRVGLDPVKELGFLLFHEAEKKSDTRDAMLFNGLVGAWGDLRQQARTHVVSQVRGSQMTFEFDDEEA
jgi:putative DNA methylase